MNQTVSRALSVLPLLARKPASLEDVAAHLETHKSTALRLLRTLHEHGLVYRQNDFRYRLGAQLFALAQEALESIDIREVARPHLESLNEATGHTIHLAVRQEDEVVYVDKVESRYPLRMYSRVGRPVPISAAAVAKCLVADLPEAERRDLAERIDYPRYTENSVRTAAAWLAELERIRVQGYATDLQSHEETLNCIGVPVRGADGRAVAACSISAPVMISGAEELLRHLPRLRRAADAISRDYVGRTD